MSIEIKIANTHSCSKKTILKHKNLGHADNITHINTFNNIFFFFSFINYSNSSLLTRNLCLIIFESQIYLIFFLFYSVRNCDLFRFSYFCCLQFNAQSKRERDAEEKKWVRKMLYMFGVVCMCSAWNSFSRKLLDKLCTEYCIYKS